MSDFDWADALRVTFTKAMQEGQTATRPDPSRVRYLRISSFPFCARHWFLNLPTATASAVVEDVERLWFLHIGTTAHDILQKAISAVDLARGGLLIQDWICTDCGKRHVFCPNPGRCTHCGHPGLKHAETRVHYSATTIGHMDGCLAFPNKKGAPYTKQWHHVPLDYKTTTLTAVATKGQLPYNDNVEQLCSYGAILTQQGYNVPGVCLIYVPRDNPHKFQVCPVTLDADAQLKRIARYERLYRQARECKTLAAAHELPPVVEKGFKEACRYCKYVPLCERYERDTEVLTPYFRTSLACGIRLRNVSHE